MSDKQHLLAAVSGLPGRVLPRSCLSVYVVEGAGDITVVQ